MVSKLWYYGYIQGILTNPGLLEYNNLKLQQFFIYILLSQVIVKHNHMQLAMVSANLQYMCFAGRFRQSA